MDGTPRWTELTAIAAMDECGGNGQFGGSMMEAAPSTPTAPLSYFKVQMNRQRRHISELDVCSNSRIEVRLEPQRG
jgi:hypothetical protein